MKKKSVIRKDALLSEEIEELIHHDPHWIVRNGSWLFFVLLVVILAGTWIIRLPTAGHQRLFDRIFERHWKSSAPLSDSPLDSPARR